MNISSVPFKSLNVMFLSTTRPSIWWKIGLWVASTASERYTRPGQMMRMGGACFSMVRICMGLVCVRSSTFSVI